MVATDQQWELILEKYERLMWKIAHNISGDNAIASLEDNYQDLCVAAMDAIQGFQKKTGKTFDEFWDSEEWGRIFDKYIKTCLWNLKNNKGAKITKKYPITKKTVNLADSEEILLMAGSDDGAMEDKVFLSEVGRSLDDDQKECLRALVNDPRLLHPSGKVNISKLARHLDKPWLHTDQIVESISKIINNNL